MAVKSRRSYQGKPVSNTLGSQLLVGGTSISLSAAMSGWPTTAEPFFCVIDPGTAKEEKVCVVYATTTTLTVVDPADYTSPWGVSSNGRGVDNTTAYQHEAGAVIYPCITAREMDEANELVSTYKAQGSIVHQGASTFTELAIGTAGQVLKVNSGATAPEWGQVPTAGIADSAVTSAKIADGTIVAGDLAAAALKLLCPVGTISAYGGTSAPTGWLLCDGSSISGSYTELIALVGANTPNLRGRVLVGRDASQTEFDTMFETGGSKTHTLTTSEIPSHQHNISEYTHTVSQSNALTTHSHTADGDLTAATGGAHTHTGSANTAGSHSHDILARALTDVTSHQHAASARLAPATSVGTETTRTTESGGSHGHTLDIDTMGSHTHDITGSTSSVDLSHGHSVSVAAHAAKNTDAAGSGSAHNNLQPYSVITYIIKHDY